MALSLEELRRFRTLTIIALFSDDDLLDTLVLKGGNALDIGYGMNSRASIDLDFSMSQDFESIGLTNLEEVRQRLEFVLSRTFFDNGYKVFDVKMISKPKTRTPKTPYFWAGYEANFKVIENDKFEAHKNEPIWLTNKSISVSDTKKNITIDFGMHEYLGDITMAELDGYIVPIYTPTLIVLEK
ncbi:nucleotidyl transferase AbiEii/AbiGii toxin family protein [Paenibacillus sp. FSL H8-0537]|uniref:nucleotidyl transferase AbiEii/AbiGii toxin family protein n=1 Tax=Paenibacillus sp. FSL H8-0537 TaxID=2921399 RepID=UPI003100F560